MRQVQDQKQLPEGRVQAVTYPHFLNLMRKCLSEKESETYTWLPCLSLPVLYMPIDWYNRMLSFALEAVRHGTLVLVLTRGSQAFAAQFSPRIVMGFACQGQNKLPGPWKTISLPTPLFKRPGPFRKFGLERQKRDLLRTEWPPAPTQFICWSPHPQCDCTWSCDLLKGN